MSFLISETNTGDPAVQTLNVPVALATPSVWRMMLYNLLKKPGCNGPECYIVYYYFPEQEDPLSTLGTGTHLMAALSRKLSCGITRVSGDDKYRSNWTCCFVWWGKDASQLHLNILIPAERFSSPSHTGQLTIAAFTEELSMLGRSDRGPWDGKVNISVESNSRSKCLNSNDVESQLIHSHLQAMLNCFLPSSFCCRPFGQLLKMEVWRSVWCLNELF